MMKSGRRLTAVTGLYSFFRRVPWGSIWVKRELLFSLEQERFEGKIIPVLFQPCDYERLSWTLSAIQMIDFTQTFEQGCRDLLRVWGLGYRSV